MEQASESVISIFIFEVFTGLIRKILLYPIVVAAVRAFSQGSLLLHGKTSPA